MKIRFFLIFLLIFLNGCTLIYSYSDNLPQRINQWIIEKKYKIALDTISHIKPTHKNYKVIQRKKKTILKLIVSYKKKAIAKSTRLVNQGNWVMALNLLDKVEKNIIDTKTIVNHRNKILNERNKMITKYENDVLNSQAIYLVEKMSLYEKIYKTVSKNEKNELDIAKFNLFRQKTSLRLTKRCEQQYDNGQYDSALTTINLAVKLNPTSKTTPHLNELKEKITKAIKLNKSSYVNDVKNLLNKLSQGYSHAILKETKEKIAWLNKIKGKEKVYFKLITKLEKHFIAGMKQKFEAARKLYSKGKTQEALSIWIDLRELDPENPKLLSHIKRAEKVLSKLKKLTNKPKK